MKQRLASLVMVFGLLALVAPGATTQPARKPIAVVVHLWTPPLFTPDGRPAVDRDMRLGAIATALDGLQAPALATVPVALAPSGVMCDEVMRLHGPAPTRFLRSLRKLASRSLVLSAPFAGVRLPDLADGNDVRREIASGRAAISRCTDRLPSGILYPPGLDLNERVVAAVAPAGMRISLSDAVEQPVRSGVTLVPARPSPAHDKPDALLERNGDSPAFVTILEAGPDLATSVLALHRDPRIDVRGVDAVATDAQPGSVTFDDPAPTPASYRHALVAADAAFERLESFTTPDNPLVPIFRTVLARARSSADLGSDWNAGRRRADRLTAVVRSDERGISVRDGAITFTSRRGSVPVTITNRDSFPVRVLVTVSSPKLDFPGGSSRVVTVQPPGDTFTFAALTRSTGSFPMLAAVSTPDGSFTFDRGDLTVRSTAANLPALALTIAGAFFLIVFYVRRIARRGPTGAST